MLYNYISFNNFSSIASYFNYNPEFRYFSNYIELVSINYLVNYSLFKLR